MYSLCAIHRHIKIFDSSLFHQLFSQILLYQYVYLMYSTRLTCVVFTYWNSINMIGSRLHVQTQWTFYFLAPDENDVMHCFKSTLLHIAVSSSLDRSKHSTLHPWQICSFEYQFDSSVRHTAKPQEAFRYIWPPTTV